jgi:mannose-1-phosphate guanylyltransferase
MSGTGPRLWAVVLAGGDGERLRPLTRLVHGDDRPKQFAVLDGRRSMLTRTLERVAWLVPPERTIIVSQRRHDAFIRATPRDPRIRVFAQPLGRGTAPAILWPAAWIAARDAAAVIVAFPTDHFVRDEQALVGHIRRVASTADGSHIILLGARASSPETGYGWIEVGRRLGADRPDLFSVRSFSEKPSHAEAEARLARGDLWNTLLFLAAAQTLAAVARRTLPDIAQAFAGLSEVSDGATPAAEAAYEGVRSADVSRDILQVIGPQLLVSRLPPIGWSDWGTPERVLEAAAHLAGGGAPAGAAHLFAGGRAPGQLRLDDHEGSAGDQATRVLVPRSAHPGEPVDAHQSPRELVASRHG